MTNIDHAAEIIAESITRDSAPAHEIVADLEHDGLLMPDLPDYDYTGSITAWMADDPVLTVTAHSILGVSLISEVNEQGVGGAEVNLTVEGARTVALALLAAADYAERNQ